MEEVRDQEEFKHVCKLCNKRYPSGKSLGGHMRSHVIANAHKKKPIIPQKALNFVVDEEEEEEDDDEDDDEEEEEEDEFDEIIGGNQREKENGNEGKNSGYGLRENPKKTWRLVDSTMSGKQLMIHPFHLQQHQQQERVCKQCGKGFHSLKALCGHMSSHSEKDRNFKEEDDNSWSSDSKEQLISAMESHSDNSKRQTRSSLSRYKSLTTVDSLSPAAGGGGSSSNHSEIDQHEQEEVAMCLMMLSRDSYSCQKSCFNFAAESSDNNSVILEGGSSSNYVGIGGKRKDLNLIDNYNKIKKVVVVAKEEINVNHQEMNNSDSGYFENGAKDLESDDSVDGFVRSYGFKKAKIHFGSNRTVVNSFNDDDSRKKRIREVGSFKFDSPESDKNSSKKIMKQDYYCYNNNSNNPIKKGSKYECWVCNKTFKTHQALGGHIISHRKTGESNLDTSISPKQQQFQNCSAPKNLLPTATTAAATASKTMASNKSKKAKGHKCPYCPKVFKSGQALGGHKRSHMIGGGSGGIVNLNLETERSKRAPPPPEPEPRQLQQQQQPPLIDLNLPAPMEEEGTGNSHFVTW